MSETTKGAASKADPSPKDAKAADATAATTAVAAPDDPPPEPAGLVLHATPATPHEGHESHLAMMFGEVRSFIRAMRHPPAHPRLRRLAEAVMKEDF